MSTISIIGATFIGNRGAEAMLSTTIRRIKEACPQCRFAVYSYYPKSDKNLVRRDDVKVASATPSRMLLWMFPLSAAFAGARIFRLKFLHALFPESLLLMARSKVLIDLSGVSFMDSRKKVLPYDVLIILTARLLGVPVVKFAQALGPFERFPNGLCARLFLKRCRKIFARGRRTLKLLEDAGFQGGHVELASDVALLHEEGDSLTEENSAYVEEKAAALADLKAKGEPVVGLCPSSVVAKLSRKEDGGYEELLCRVTRKLVEKGFQVLLFPNATKDDDMARMRNNDLHTIAAVAARLREHGEADLMRSVTCTDRNINSDGIRKLVKHVDVAVVSRFHAMIAALCLAKPVLVLGWSHKYLEIMEPFDQDGWVFDYKRCADLELDDKIQDLYSSRAEISEALAGRLDSVKALASKQIAYVVALLNDS